MNFTETVLLKKKLDDVTSDIEKDAMHTIHNKKVLMNDIVFVQDGESIVMKSPDFFDKDGAFITRGYVVSQLLNKLNYNYNRAFAPLPTEIQIDILNFLIDRKTKKNEYKAEYWYIPVSTMNPHQYEVKAILSSKYQYISTWKLVNDIMIALDKAGLNYKPRDCYHSQTATTVRFIDEDSGHPVRVGDEVKVGFQLVNSETGHSSIRLQLVTERITCANMAIFTRTGDDVIDKIRHIWIDPKRVREAIVDTVTGAREEFEKLKPLMDKATNMLLPISYGTKDNKVRIWTGRPQEDFERLFDESAPITRKALNAIIMAYQMESGNSVWDILNAINYASAMKNVSAEEELYLQEMFGKLLLELEHTKESPIHAENWA